MATHKSVFLRQAECGSCRERFYVCSNCERGQRYCGLTCRQEARRRHCRAYNRHYQQGFDGRRLHAQRQARYRKRWRKRRAQKVTDHSLVFGLRSVNLGFEKHNDLKPLSRCAICGRVGVVVRHWST